MEQIPKDSYFFYFSIPLDRLQQIFSFGWIALWEDHLYGNKEDISIINFNGCPDFGSAAKEALETLQTNIKASFDGRERSPNKETATYARNQFSKHSPLLQPWKFFAKTPKELIDKVVTSENNNLPQFIRDELKKLVI